MISPQIPSSLASPCSPWGESLSALVDGECQADELAAVLRADASDAELQSTWEGYLAVGAALRGATGCAAMPARAEFVASVMERLASEPRHDAHRVARLGPGSDHSRPPGAVAMPAGRHLVPTDTAASARS